MAATTKKHPALPAEPGWYLFRVGINATPRLQGKWRAGYTGKTEDFRTSSYFDTEQEAIDWIWAEHRKKKAAEQHGDIVQRWLCSPLQVTQS